MAQIIIAGGGIGGLATALSVARQGHRVLVLEGRSDFTELGAGIQLAPNAFHALDRLGVGDSVRARAVHIDELCLMDGTTGRRIAGLPLDDAYRRRFANPYAVVRRVDLYAPLLQACRASTAVRLRTRARVAHYTQDDAGVTVHLASGERVRGAALIGADGIRSAVRGQLVGDGGPRVSGHTIYRSVIPMEAVPEELRWNTVTLWAGPDRHFVHYPIGNGRFLNLAATVDDGATEEVTGTPVSRARVLAAFPRLGETPRRLLGLGEDWRSWVLCDRDPVRRWTDRRVVLVGDAAHPMLQYAAQGACQTLEDAVVLGDLIGTEEADFERHFEEFADERRDRTAAAQLTAREMGRRLYHATGEAARRRDTDLGALSVRDLHDRVEWLHGARSGARDARPAYAAG
ncbi:MULTISPECIES: 3-hydroxybenzoate 6-monooxygenase [Streptomyces]|uniref:Oxidoreductase n=2 Tax=Streptomyces bottropensis TaxID=42235 RepID=M3D7D4_9ACTN|nr:MULTISPECIES: 3-hydroxybenzoate 6-monooxygenase [Streptomyces]EMF52127.1 oxidoreductase [Streptomyces bottropensis ATCC 25435]MZD22561.1 3-hydroxybenzoate 6-monooxygenase [Streptomyces sp. SID5476]